MSNLDLNQAHATSWQIGGRELHPSRYYLFCCHRLNMVCNVPFFFRIHSIGMACLSPAGIHHPAVVYHLIFQASSGWNASGNLGNLCLSCFDSSIKGILWRTSWSGGSSSGSGPNRSLNNSMISSWSWGMSLSVYSLVGFFNSNDSWDGHLAVLYFVFSTRVLCLYHLYW